MRVSVIIPSYNYGHLIGEAIRSVQEQTVDGPRDDRRRRRLDGRHARRVLESIMDPRLRARRVGNGGVAAARNIALEMARGDFIAFLDADDRWLPPKLERHLALFESEPEVGLVFSDFTRFDDAHVYRATHFDHLGGAAHLPSRPSRDGGGRVDRRATRSPLLAAMPQPAGVAVRHDGARPRRGRESGSRPACGSARTSTTCSASIPRVRAAFIAEPLAELRRHGGNSYASLLEIGAAAAAVPCRPRPTSRGIRTHQRQVLRHGGWAGELTGLAYAHFHLRNARAAAWAAARAMRFPGSRGAALRRLALIPALPLIADPTNVDWTEKPELGTG
jgi:hypothetical protein